MCEVLHEEKVSKQIAATYHLNVTQVKQAIQLLHAGNTVPFIARYRKELTGGMDEVMLRHVSEQWEYANNLFARQQEAIRLIAEKNSLTDELKRAIMNSTTLQEVEDLYRPFRSKRRTRATVAKEKGLEPFASWLFSFPVSGDVNTEAKKYVSEELTTTEEVIAGGKDIIAEWIADDPKLRRFIRTETLKKGKWKATLKDVEKDEQKTYEMYYEYEEALTKIVPHRILAMNRGEKEGSLQVNVVFPTTEIIETLKREIIQRDSIANRHVEEAIEDSYRRLLEPTIEREIRSTLKEKAEARAIEVFAENLRQLLLQPLLKGNVVLGIDPAYRTGCKLAVVDETGKVLETSVIYPTPPLSKVSEAKAIVKKLIDTFGIQVIAIGNGTASRETEMFVADLLQDFSANVQYVIVNEAGASVYSASDVARDEFPNLQVQERSAASIARRLQDPLAELVKIDPKSIGVGQYQHDVSQRKLSESLTFIVETVVNQVGVDINTASVSLLQYVAGITKTVAENVIKKREEIGRFTNREQLKDVPRLGPKTYEQCIGFLRIRNGDNVFDSTAIHPESYEVASDILLRTGLNITELGSPTFQEQLTALSVPDMAEKLAIGEPTLKDIIDSFIRPGRDPRDDLPKPLLRSDILTIKDLKTGMELVGTVRNIVDFGAFIDIGVEREGLVHISKLSERYVKHPLDVVQVGETVTVYVDDVDLDRGRVSLTMLSV